MLQSVKGTRDLLPQISDKFRHIEDRAAVISQLYGFQEIQTPILEPTGLFLRTLGDTSDIVTKEMYRFTDAGGDDLVLRPEGTAGVARAFINEGLSQNVPVKLFYRGPMFRRERPQRGRYRQFNQFGLELLGVEKPQADLEVLACAYRILKDLGVMGTITLHLNTLGDAESRSKYREVLTAYLEGFRSQLSTESQDRLVKNPLRVLDSKSPADQAIVAGAPKLSDCLTASAREFFNEVQAGLSKLEIPAIVDERLVRGLDYYCHTVFEFTTTALGAQSAVLAGGRYDGLVKDLGGPQTPGVGWAFGVDRLAELLPTLEDANPMIALVPLGDEAEARALTLSEELRSAGFKIELGYSGNMAKRMKRADKVGAKLAIIMGSDELAKGVVGIKNLKTGAQSEAELANLRAVLKLKLSEVYSLA
ncbi:MAG: histidine--tRNA ligase [Bdellovibrionales bacterium]|jgi:histidyl-tRNA synthetase|nr:histidine--tRNA ligase [Bdellovibrionales bacterium]